MKRKSISKKLRFEIFKRDEFTCQYCGRKPPEIILNLEHMVPVKLGGGNDDDNLITSCRDCNAGKSANPLDEKLIPPLKKFDEAQEREKYEQLRAYQKTLKAKIELREESFKIIKERWESMCSEDWSFPYGAEEAIRQFMRLLPIEQILDAVNITHEKMGNKPWVHVRYFCGVCWRKIKGTEPKPLTPSHNSAKT